MQRSLAHSSQRLIFELPETSGEEEAGEGEASPPCSSPAGGREGLGATRGQGAPTPRRSRGRAQGAGLTAGASKAPLGSEQGSSGGAKPSSATPSPLGGAHLVPHPPQPGAHSALGPGALRVCAQGWGGVSWRRGLRAPHSPEQFWVRVPQWGGSDMDTGMVLPAACRQAQLVARPAAPSGGRGRASHPTHSAPGSAGDFHLCLCAPELQALGFLLSAAMPKPSSLPPGVALWWVSVFAPPSCTPLATFQSSQASCLLPTPCHHTMVPPTVPISVPAMLCSHPGPPLLVAVPCSMPVPRGQRCQPCPRHLQRAPRHRGGAGMAAQVSPTWVSPMALGWHPRLSARLGCSLLFPSKQRF